MPYTSRRRTGVVLDLATRRRRISTATFIGWSAVIDGLLQSDDQRRRQRCQETNPASDRPIKSQRRTDAEALCRAVTESRAPSAAELSLSVKAPWSADRQRRSVKIYGWIVSSRLTCAVRSARWRPSAEQTLLPPCGKLDSCCFYLATCRRRCQPN